MEQICVVGVGYVGLVTAACFADLGNRVVALDVDEKKIQGLNNGIMPIYEPGLEELVERNLRAGRLSFTTSYQEGLKEAEFAFIAVGTPPGVEGEADLTFVAAAAQSIAKNMHAPLIIINKSTVPVGTGDWVAEIVKTHQPKPIDFAVVSCPEFLREGSAILDFMNPHRIVLGSLKRSRRKSCPSALPLRAPIIVTDLRTAEMIKYASNAFLATKISFINEIANICEALGADVKEVAVGMGYDTRIGKQFLDAGLGYGGSCFPKDVLALAHMAEEKGHHPQLLHAVMKINQDRRKMAVDRVREMLGSLQDKVIGLLGLAFKPNTDDMRDAPALDIAKALIKEGARVKAYDPVAMEVAASLLPEVQLCPDSYAVAESADLLMIITDWNEFKFLDLERIKTFMRSPNIFDGENIYDPEKVRSLGFNYYAIGRGYNGTNSL
jgi:UDPglucose 6-dehydrogenase